MAGNTFTVYVRDAALWEHARAFAANRGVSLSHLIAEAVQAKLDAEGWQEPEAPAYDGLTAAQRGKRPRT